MKKIDYHCHFSGSLSIDFLSSFPGGKELSMPKFGQNWQRNFNTFFSSYAQIQNITKSDWPLQQISLYSNGSKDICKNYIKEAIDEFHLRIGPRISLEETVRRIVSTSRGFKLAEEESGKGTVGKIILTLIHDKNGHFINVSKESFRELLSFLHTHPSESERVIGFDFSGPENVFDQNMLFILLEILCDYNLNHKGCFEIAIHAGEYIDGPGYLTTFDYLEKLLKYKIHRISHGTILWINPDLINKESAAEIAKMQEHLLAIIADKRIHLEICPTANLLLSPLKKIEDIPLKKFEDLGINYSLNTDNKTIFKTELKKEWSHFPDAKANPFDTAVKGS